MATHIRRGCGSKMDWEFIKMEVTANHIVSLGEGVPQNDVDKHLRVNARSNKNNKEHEQSIVISFQIQNQQSYVANQFVFYPFCTEMPSFAAFKKLHRNLTHS